MEAGPICRRPLREASFTVCLLWPVQVVAGDWRATMSFIALGAFVVILGFGKAYGAWSDAGGQLHITVIICFLLGAVCGYKARG